MTTKNGAATAAAVSVGSVVCSPGHGLSTCSTQTDGDARARYDEEGEGGDGDADTDAEQGVVGRGRNGTREEVDTSLYLTQVFVPPLNFAMVRAGRAMHSAMLMSHSY